MKAKQYIPITLLWILLSSFSYKLGGSYKQVRGLKTVVIDAGHGGSDTGAPGEYSYEKNIALAVALKLGALMKVEMPDVNIVYTRTTDVFDPPQLKAWKANNAKGDLFISIHCNSADPIRHSEFVGYKYETRYVKKKKKKIKQRVKVPQYRYWTTPNPAKGTETYIWGAHKNEEKELAMKENEALYLDSTLATQVSDFNPDAPEKMILYALKTKQYFTRSANLALTVEDEFKKVGRISREARQRQVGIWVLQATAMPSILVETGYISNREEEDYLNSQEGQNEIAEVIVKSLKRYQYSLQHQTLEFVTPANVTPGPDSTKR
ncbi:N-acetylmuramoyl-L-alanine amidase family protein [Foetidibacter luteolus]|uniref:N-acetylmuramoyl-L-alanine amidase family protein n=1 Tax=Foetidibacter luteolus TaxID=2608880 RepID=UPI00129BC130|nr:N-acetylmuramoyl-L-alanine amidase [Foetidibacter luteolus]